MTTGSLTAVPIASTATAAATPTVRRAAPAGGRVRATSMTAGGVGVCVAAGRVAAQGTGGTRGRQTTQEGGKGRESARTNGVPPPPSRLDLDRARAKAALLTEEQASAERRKRVRERKLAQLEAKEDVLRDCELARGMRWR